MEKTLLKGLRILEILARNSAPRGVSDIARDLGLTRSNAHRLLQTLTAGKFVVHDPVLGQYSLSLKLFELGMLIGSRIDVRTAARPIMAKIVEKTSENVSLAVLDGRDVIYIERADSPNPVRAVVRTGERLPAHCTSSGKVLLAWSDETQVDLLAGHLTGYTATTITDMSELKKVLARIKKAGYGASKNEWHLELSSIAVPVRSRDGVVIAALAVSGPTSRFRATNIAGYRQLLEQGAREISLKLT